MGRRFGGFSGFVKALNLRRRQIHQRTFVSFVAFISLKSVTLEVPSY